MKFKMWRIKFWTLVLLAMLVVGGGGWLLSLSAISLHVVTFEGSALAIEETAGDEGTFKLAFYDSEKRVALGATGGRITLWDVRKAIKIGELPSPRKSYRAHDLISLELVDEKTLAGAYKDGTIAIWNLEQRNIRTILSTSSKKLSYINLYFRSDTLIALSDTEINVWKLSKARLIWKYTISKNERVFCSESSIEIYSKNRIIKRDLKNGKIVLNKPQFYDYMVFSDKDKVIVSVNNRTRIEIWNNSLEKRLASFPLPNGMERYEHDNSKIYVLSKSGLELYILDLLSLNLIAKLNFQKKIKTFGIFRTHKGKRMVTLDNLRALELWNLDSGLWLNHLEDLNSDWNQLNVETMEEERAFQVDNGALFGPTEIFAYDIESADRIWQLKSDKINNYQQNIVKIDDSKYLFKTSINQVVIRNIKTGYNLATTRINDNFLNFWTYFLASDVFSEALYDWKKDIQFLVIKRGWAAMLP